MRQGDPVGRCGEGVPDGSQVGWAQKMGRGEGRQGPTPVRSLGLIPRCRGVILLQAPLAVRMKAVERGDSGAIPGLLKRGDPQVAESGTPSSQPAQDPPSGGLPG